MHQIARSLLLTVIKLKEASLDASYLQTCPYRYRCQNEADDVRRIWYLGSGGGALDNIFSSSYRLRRKINEHVQ